MLSKTELGDILEALTQACDYFDQRMDADWDEVGFIPNLEMRLMQLCEKALEVVEPTYRRQSPYVD